jgi:hypothetical protein
VVTTAFGHTAQNVVFGCTQTLAGTRRCQRPFHFSSFCVILG